MAPIEHVIALSVMLFTIGVVGVVVRRNLMAMLMSVQLMLGGVGLAFVGFGRLHAGRVADGAHDGHVFALLVIGVGVAQLAVALGMVVALVRNRDSMNVEDASVLKW
jgi:NADH-quinone oxidoreductase subunit K